MQNAAIRWLMGDWEPTRPGICSIDGDGEVTSGGDGVEGIDGITGDNPMDILNPPSDDEPPADDEGSGDKKPPVTAAWSEEDRTRFDKMEERTIAAQQEATYLRGQNNILQAQVNGQQRRETPPPPKEEPLFAMPSKEELSKAFENPETAVEKIYGMFQDLGAAVEKRVKGLDSDTKTTLAQRDAQQRADAAYRADGAKAIDEFGRELLQDPEFIAEGDKEIEEIIKLRGGDRYLPGDFYTAASRVHSKWLRSGKLKVNSNGTNGNGNGAGTRETRPSLREVTRQVPASDDLGNRRSAGGGNGNGSAKTLKDLGLSPTEERVARITMNKLHVSEADFVRNTLAARKEDPDFGK